MHVDTSVSRQRGKTYTRHLLRHSYREDGKVKKRTLANLSHCTDEEIAAKRAEEAEALAAEITSAGGSAIAMPANLDRGDDVDEMFSKVEATYGSVDVLINNAGTYPNSTILDMSQDEWNKMYADNVVSVFLCTKAAAISMKQAGGGAIVNISSMKTVIQVE